MASGCSEKGALTASKTSAEPTPTASATPATLSCARQPVDPASVSRRIETKVQATDANSTTHPAPAMATWSRE